MIRYIISLVLIVVCIGVMLAVMFNQKGMTEEWTWKQMQDSLAIDSLRMARAHTASKDYEQDVIDEHLLASYSNLQAYCLGVYGEHGYIIYQEIQDSLDVHCLILLGKVREDSTVIEEEWE